MRHVLPAVVLTALAVAGAQTRNVYTPFTDARSVFEALRAELLPADFRGKPASAIETEWPHWIEQRDAGIRARLEQGDEDSVVNFLLFGVTFTRQPRISEREMDAGLAGVREVVDARIDDMVAAIAKPERDERLDFVREIARRKGIDPASDAGRGALVRYLNDQIVRFLADREAVASRAVAAATRAMSDPAAAAPVAGTLFSQRGLSSDTTIYVDFGIEAALDAIKSNNLLAPGSVRRVAIVGPGLDFADKREGYDFYPVQTLQPFAVIDSLKRLGLAGREMRVTTLDLSPRINGHIERARTRARSGEDYILQLPRETSVQWNPLLVKYWQQLGDQIGKPSTIVRAPAGIEMRAVAVRPEIVESIAPEDLNIVLQRPAALAPADRYDLIVATNILVYYDVFEQSLAMTNIATMLRPGGLLLTNSPVFELPSTPMRSVGYTDILYEQRDAGRDRVFWYQRQ